FRTADDWLEYNQKFGSNNPTATVMLGFRRAAMRTALMREFGTKPLEAFERDLHYLLRRASGTDNFQEMERNEKIFRHYMAQLDGSAQRPVNRTHARVVAGWLAWQRMAKLGLTPFAMV